jgi:hypothetical protein
VSPQKQSARLRREAAAPYRKWLNEDVTYIITEDERSAFKRLNTDADRKQFIEQLWLRRDPTPGAVKNEFGPPDEVEDHSSGFSPGRTVTWRE